MKLQQLKYIVEVAKQNLNISHAADSLFTSQPGVSKQIRALEQELGIEIFSRSGKHLSGITPGGEVIIRLAQQIIQQTQNIKLVAKEHTSPNKGTLGIATTHTQARYALPAVISRFIAKYPNVSLHMHQGTPQQIAQFTLDGTVDFAIATESFEHFSDLIMLPCYKWNRAVVVPPNHPLTQESPLTLAKLSKYPLITYVFGVPALENIFNSQQLHPQVVLTAVDADVIKTYVRLGLGVGIVAKMAVDDKTDTDLVALDASGFFPDSITKIGFRRDKLLRKYMYAFINFFAPHLDENLVKKLALCVDQNEINELLHGVKLPRH